MESDPCKSKYFIAQRFGLFLVLGSNFKMEDEICMSLTKSIVINARPSGEVRQNGACL